MVLTTQYQVAVTSSVSPIKEPADLLLVCGCTASFDACLVLPTSRKCLKGSQGQKNLNKWASPTVTPNYGGWGGY